MKKSPNWKKEYGMFEASKEEIVYFESYQGKEVTFEEIVANGKKKNQTNLQKHSILVK